MYKRTVGVNCEKKQKIWSRKEKRVIEITTLGNNPIWTLLKKYINSLEIGRKFRRKNLLRSVYDMNVSEALNHSQTSIDTYRVYITRLGCIEHVKRGVYKKIMDVPEQLTSSNAKKLAYEEKWKIWFMLPEDW